MNRIALRHRDSRSARIRWLRARLCQPDAEKCVDRAAQVVRARCGLRWNGNRIGGALGRNRARDLRQKEVDSRALDPDRGRGRRGRLASVTRLRRFHAGTRLGRAAAGVAAGGAVGGVELNCDQQCWTAIGFARCCGGDCQRKHLRRQQVEDEEQPHHDVGDSRRPLIFQTRHQRCRRTRRCLRSSRPVRREPRPRPAVERRPVRRQDRSNGIA